MMVAYNGLHYDDSWFLKLSPQSDCCIINKCLDFSWTLHTSASGFFASGIKVELCIAAVTQDDKL